jgi:hypothetical protein
MMGNGTVINPELLTPSLIRYYSVHIDGCSLGGKPNIKVLSPNPGLKHIHTQQQDPRPKTLP